MFLIRLVEHALVACVINIRFKIKTESFIGLCFLITHLSEVVIPAKAGIQVNSDLTKSGSPIRSGMTTLRKFQVNWHQIFLLAVNLSKG